MKYGGDVVLNVAPLFWGYNPCSWER